MEKMLRYSFTRARGASKEMQINMSGDLYKEGLFGANCQHSFPMFLTKL